MIDRLRRSSSATALGALLVLAGCGGGRGAIVPDTRPGAPSFGVYQGRLQQAGRRDRRFKVLLFAALPDRVHAEVLSPLGRTEMILDGGAGRVAITIVPDGVSFLGRGGPGSLERVLGVPVGLEALVRALLTGEVVEAGFDLDRSGSVHGSLPDSLEIRAPNSTLSLALKRIRPLTEAGPGVGTGEPPPGTERRPLEELTAWERFEGGGDSP